MTTNELRHHHWSHQKFLQPTCLEDEGLSSADWSSGTTKRGKSRMLRKTWGRWWIRNPEPDVNFAREIKTIRHLVTNVGKLPLNSATFFWGTHTRGAELSVRVVSLTANPPSRNKAQWYKWQTRGCNNPAPPPRAAHHQNLSRASRDF